MPLDFQTVDVRFTQGLDTRTQKKLVMSGKWTALTNYSLSKDNTPVRRDGAQTIIAAQNGNGLLQRNEELVTINAGVATSISATVLGASKQVPGEVPYVD